MSRATKAVVGVALLGVAGVAGLVAAEQLRRPSGPPVPTSVPTSTAEVTQETIAERQYVTGTLGYTGSYTVPGAGQGTLTWRPPIGTVVNRGGALYEVDGQRVTLMYGTRPAWRDLANGISDGVDVEQLENNLRTLGFGGGLTVDQKFTGATATAIRRWQRAAHVTVTGAVTLGTITFMPGAVRISGYQMQPGDQVRPGGPVEYATSTTPAVNLAASTQQLGWIRVGTPVVVILPDGKSRNGKVTSIGATTGSSSATSSSATSSSATSSSATSNDSTGSETTTAAVTIRLDGEVAGFVDQAAVQVWVVRATHRDVLTVPIAALNSVSDSTYELIVVDTTGTRRVPVKTGLFDDLSGTAEVSGPGLTEGQKVQVPSEAG